MIEDDRAANLFIEGIKENIAAEAAKPKGPIHQPTAHITINRAVRCTIIVGQPPEQDGAQRRRAARKA